MDLGELSDKERGVRHYGNMGLRYSTARTTTSAGDSRATYRGSRIVGPPGWIFVPPQFGMFGN